MHLLVDAITPNSVCLHLLVPPLAHFCFFHASRITACTVGGCTLERKTFFATTSFKKGQWLVFEGGPILGRLRVHKSAQERAARVRACNTVKFETGWNLPPVLQIVTHTGHAAC